MSCVSTWCHVLCQYMVLCPVSVCFDIYVTTWTPKPGKFHALDFYIDKCRRDINKIKFNNPPKRFNISLEERRALIHLRQREDIFIKPADKGGAVVVWHKQLYMDEAYRQLTDDQHYTQETEDMTSIHNNVIQQEINRLIVNGDLPKSAVHLIVPNPRTAKFYILPKIHKANTPGRPIVSACNCPTERISSFLDDIMQPIVHSLPSYIKDTTDALQTFQNYRFSSSSNKLVFSMDVKSLYTSIPHSEGLKALRHFFDKRTHKYPPTETLLCLAELVLTNNSFSFDNKYFRQLNGVAMGTKMGPSYACLFMGYLEETIFKSYRGPTPDLYKRFIDDIIGASSLPQEHLEQFIQYMQSFHPAIEYTYSITHKQLPFLDTEMTPTDDDTISTSVYYKETDSHNILRYDSSHPTSCKNSIPYAQFIRLRRICSDNTDFHEKAEEQTQFFLNQGYPEDIIETAFSKVKNQPRHSVLQYQDSSTDVNKRIPLVLTYHPTNIQVKNVIFENYPIISTNHETRDIFDQPPLLSWKKDNNLQHLLVSSATSHPSGSNKPCNRPRCKTCKYITDTKAVSCHKSKFNVTDTFTCTSTNLIYCIQCLKCNKLYIGETMRRLADRSAEHLKSITDHNIHLPVAVHFNQADHSIDDYSIFGLKLTHNSHHRKELEKRLIFKLNTTQPHGINLKFSFT